MRTAREAVERSETNLYNLALIDIRLPDMEGTVLLAKMREATPKMAIIMITGYPSLENAAEAVSKGSDGYLIKPVRIDELTSKIEEHLQRQEVKKNKSKSMSKRAQENMTQETKLGRSSHPRIATQA